MFMQDSLGTGLKMRCHNIATCSWVNDGNVGEVRDVVELLEPDTIVCDPLDLRGTHIHVHNDIHVHNETKKRTRTGG